ncbi:hypothetical protein AAEX63_02410 [Luteococcus sp. H138]|uniref:hypothetical protein n=1 Tax=unclassified Luteococcus TaxID=2639923 RepID=UPI00313EE6E3
MDSDKTPKTDFGWIRMGCYTLIIMAIWAVCWVVTTLVTSTLSIGWVEASFPGVGLALAGGALWEYLRREKARKQIG